MYSVTLITAGLSSQSSTTALGLSITQELAALLGPETKINVVELHSIAHDMVDYLLGNPATPALSEAFALAAGCDALVAVTPIYQAASSGIFKMFFDCLEPNALIYKPVIIAARSGSPRHALVLEQSLRPLFSYLRALVVPTGIVSSGVLSEQEQAIVDMRIRSAAAECATLVRSGFSDDKGEIRN